MNRTSDSSRAADASQAPTSFVTDAHGAGLLVHPYTFRNENSFLSLELRHGNDAALWGNAIAEYEQFFGLGVDGVFSDYPDIMNAARTVVFSQTLRTAQWANTTIAAGDTTEEIDKLRWRDPGGSVRCL